MSESEVLIVGRRAVQEALGNSRDRLIKILSTKSDSRDEILSQAAEFGIKVGHISPDELSKLSGSESHQGIGAYLRPRPINSLSDWLKTRAPKERELLLMIDAIQDPHNFGAILRSAECFGADGVIWSKNRGVQITPTVSKVSVGASELLNLIRVSNLVEAARRLRDEGFWLIGAKEGEGSESLFSFEFPKQAVIVMGSEGSGLQPLLQKQLDYSVAIPMFGKISSLNVAQAAAVFLASARRQG